MVKGLFKWCDDLILALAKETNLSYELTNLILFVFLQPGLILIEFILIVYMLGLIRAKNRMLIDEGFLKSWIKKL